MLQILITCFVIMLVSLSGAITVSKKASLFVENNLGILTSFAVGVFGVIAYMLLSEASLHASLGHVAIWVVVGLVAVMLLSHLIPEFHHHHGHDSEHSHSNKSAIRILASDGIHNIADGILITASFLAGTGIGIGVALSVFIHELVQEITQFFVLKQTGYSTKKALLGNFSVSATILVGAIGSFFFLQAFQNFEPILLGLAAGALLAVLVQDLGVISFKSAKRTVVYRSTF